jgi:hypothetical protein
VTSGNAGIINGNIASGLSATLFENSSLIQSDGVNTGLGLLLQVGDGGSSLDAKTVGTSVGGYNGAGGASKLTGGVSNIQHKTLDSGALLLSPEQRTILDTPLGSVRLDKGSVALIVMSDKGLAVYNLHDEHNNAVVINDGASVLAVSPGRSAVVTRHVGKTFEEINPAPFVAYRRVGSSAAGNQSKIYQADFDMVSMARGLPALRQLCQSDNAATRKSMAKMLKTMAIMMQVGQSSEPYALYLTQPLTACALAAGSK